MGRSRKKKRHFMDENFKRNSDDDQMSLYNEIRKPMPPKSRVHKDRTEKRKKKFNWRDEIED